MRVVRLRVAGAKFERSLKLAPRLRPVPIEEEEDITQRDVRLFGSQSCPQYRGFMRVYRVSSGGDSPSGPPRKRSQRTERPKVSVWAFGYTRYLAATDRAFGEVTGSRNLAGFLR